MEYWNETTVLKCQSVQVFKRMDVFEMKCRISLLVFFWNAKHRCLARVDFLRFCGWSVHMTCEADLHVDVPAQEHRPWCWKRVE